MMALQAGMRVTWKKGIPAPSPKGDVPADSKHLIYDAVGRILRFHETAQGAVYVEWAAPVTVKGDRRPVWLCRVDQLEEASTLPDFAAEGFPPPPPEPKRKA